MEKIQVLFRKFDNGEIVAVFPFEVWSDFYITSYMHIGQHGPMSVGGLTQTKPARIDEYAELLEELKGIYNEYELVVLDRCPNLNRIYDNLRKNLRMN